MKICSVEECTREVHRKTMCQSHYRRTRIYGSPTGGRRSPGSGSVCGVESCDSIERSKGYCNKHYLRLLKYGNADEPLRQSTISTLVGRLAEGTPTGLADTDCWEWTKARAVDGYGHVYYEGGQYRTHRIAYELATGTKVADGLVVRHKCDNPPCVNPSHLEVGTHADNSKDKVDRGRSPVGESAGRAKLTEAEVLRIRKMYTNGAVGSALADEFNVSETSIYNIVHRRNWTHI